MSPCLKRTFFSAVRHFSLPRVEELEAHGEVLELLLLRVLHDRARVLVLLDRHALLVPADRLGLLLERGDHPGERAHLGAELVRRFVVLIGWHEEEPCAREASAKPGILSTQAL